MAKLHITEFIALPRTAYNTSIPVGDMPPAASQVVTFTSSTASAAFNAQTRFIRVIADAKCHLSFGAAPTADANDEYIAADSAEYFGVVESQKVAGYDGTT